MKTISRLASERDELNVVNDQWGTPTYAGDLAEAIISIMERDDLPELRVCITSRMKVLVRGMILLKKSWRLQGQIVKVNPVTTEEYPSKVKRPAYSILDKTKIKETFNLEIRDWRKH